MIPQLLQPPTHIFKCCWLCNIIYKKSSKGTPIVGTGDCSVSLLSSCVPYLSFHSPSFNLARIQNVLNNMLLEVNKFTFMNDIGWKSCNVDTETRQVDCENVYVLIWNMGIHSKCTVSSHIYSREPIIMLFDMHFEELLNLASNAILNCNQKSHTPEPVYECQ